MVKFMVELLILLLLMPLVLKAAETTSSNSAASHEIFLGAGEALSFPTAVRYRYGDIEGGYMTREVLGAAKQFKNPFYPSLYSELGLVITPSTKGASIAPGLFGAIGGSWKIWGVLRFRAELNMVGGVSSYVRGGALVGISLAF